MYSIEYLNNQGEFTLVAKNASKKVVDLWISAQGGKYETIVVTELRS